MTEQSISHIDTIDQSEYSERGQVDFEQNISIWQKVAETRGNQLVKDKYISEEDRLKTIHEYKQWVAEKATSMKLHLIATHIFF